MCIRDSSRQWWSGLVRVSCPCRAPKRAAPFGGQCEKPPPGGGAVPLPQRRPQGPPPAGAHHLARGGGGQLAVPAGEVPREVVGQARAGRDAGGKRPRLEEGGGGGSGGVVWSGDSMVR
eukprot:303992-Pyramimonas_sp.AAC.1